MHRRSFLQYTSTLLFSNTVLGCSGNDMIASGTPIACYGDSLTAGLGGTPMSVLLRGRLPDRTIQNFGISGQKAAQIAARQGGLPTTISIEGNAFAGVAAVPVTNLSVELLSSPATRRELTLTGTLAGVHCTLIRSVTDDETETYNVRPDAFSSQPVAPHSTFLPDDALAYRSAVQVLWLGRNNAPSFADVDTMIQRCIDYMTGNKRYLVIGILPNLPEIVGTTAFNRIKLVNEGLAETHADRYIATTPPTTAEMKAIGYNPTVEDLADIKNGTFPANLRFGLNHLNTNGYKIIAIRIAHKVTQMNW